VPTTTRQWPSIIQDDDGRTIYLTYERWEHALEHVGMHAGLLDEVLRTVQRGHRRQDRLDPAKFKYTRSVEGLPRGYTHIEVVVKFGVTPADPPRENNFVLTAYLVRR
jgi:hypothetical protein